MNERVADTHSCCCSCYCCVIRNDKINLIMSTEITLKSKQQVAAVAATASAAATAFSKVCVYTHAHIHALENNYFCVYV